MTPTSARLRAVAELCPNAGIIVDVGADHGHLAVAVGAIATERMPHRRVGCSGTWVISDGLRAFRHVDVALVCGMGGHRIATILKAGPRPRVAVVAQPMDHAGELRVWLADNGYRIDAESVAMERKRLYEVVRAVPGQETAEGLALWYGPRLLAGDHPLRSELIQSHLRHLDGIVGRQRGDALTDTRARLAFLRTQLGFRQVP